MQNVKIEKGTVRITRGADKPQDARLHLLRAPPPEETFVREIQSDTVQRRRAARRACDPQPQRGSRAGTSVQGARGAGPPVSLLPEGADSYFNPRSGHAV